MTTTSIGDPLVGVVLDDRYQILERLARGGMATVYRATDMRLGRVVAVKVMHEGLGEDEGFIRKFDREARSAAKLSHPNVVAVFDQGHDAGRPYIVMEYVQGGTLRNVISADTPMDPQRALELIDSILAALCAAHESGLVHRDIKPENVLISDRGQLKVADFGLARAISAHTATSGVLIGTVSYLPPELVLHGQADRRSDIYSTGVVLFELLTGTKPYRGETPIQIAYAHVHNRIPAPSTRLQTRWQVSRNGIPPYLDALVRAATQREPDRRPEDARALRSMVQLALEALSQGVMDDPALTARFSAQFTDLKDTPGQDHTAADEEDTSPDDLEELSRHQEIAAPESSVEISLAAVEQIEHSVPVRPDPPAAARVRQRKHPRVRQHPAVTLRRRRLAGLVLLIVLTITGTGVWWVLEGRFVPSPTLTGLSQIEAEEVAENQGLTVQTTEDFNETVPAGTVVSSVPAAGENMPRRGTVTMVVSKGPERFAMPRVVGLSADDARQLLTEARLTVGTVSEDWHEELDPGLVVATSQEPGAPLRRDTAVDLTLSKGPRPIQVTNQTGRPVDTAQTALEGAGFTVSVKTAHSPTVPVGHVVSQSPASGTGHRGHTITLVRSLGPAQVKVPEVKALETAEAVAQLERAGFKVKTEHGEGFLDLGYVQRTDPPAGAEAPEGSTVTVFVI